MNREPFIYEWHELTKARKVSWKLVLQCILLALAVGFLPDLVMYLFGYGSDIYPYKLYFMLLTVPLILYYSIKEYRKEPASDITVSTLTIDGDVVTITRHVIAETGRRFFVEWQSLSINSIKTDHEQCVLQINAEWKASAYKESRNKVGRYVDSDCRTQSQTLQLNKEKYHEAVNYLETNGHGMLSMTSEELEKAQPFLHKHHGI